MLYQFKEFKPDLGADCYISPGAHVIGRCFLGDKVNIWFNCVLRGDVHDIRIGENTNIQDLSMLHVTEEASLVIGRNVSVGHSVTLHGCTVKDSCLIGMGATVLDGAVIGENSIVAAGSLVPPNKVYPAGTMIMGNPAKVVRDLTDKEKMWVANHYKSYTGYAKEFENHLRPIE